MRDVLHGDEVLETYASMCMDARYYKAYHQLWDCRYISSLQVEKDDVEAFRMMVDLYCPPEENARKRRVALLAPQLPLFMAMQSLLIITGKRSQHRKVFRTFPAAKGWLSPVLNQDAI